MNDLKKYKEKFDLILLLLIIVCSILLIYSLIYIYNYYSSNDILTHIPENINKKKDKLSPNEIGDSIGGTLNPIIAFTASILTFLAFYIQFRANKSQRDIFNLSLDNEITKLEREKTDKRIELIQSYTSNLKIFKMLILSMTKYYEDTGKELGYFIIKEEKFPLKMNTFYFLTDASNMYFNKIDFKEIYNSVVSYFNENYPDLNWEEEYIDTLNCINFYENLIIEMRSKFQDSVNKKYININQLGEKLNKNMGIIFADKYLQKSNSLNPYMEIVHNIKPDKTMAMSEEEFYNVGTDFERLHKEFFPNFISEVKVLYDTTENDKYFQILEDFSEINKGLGTEIYQSKNYNENLKDIYNSYFNSENENYPILKVKNFINRISIT